MKIEQELKLNKNEVYLPKIQVVHQMHPLGWELTSFAGLVFEMKPAWECY